jgi:hypothetical protein
LKNGRHEEIGIKVLKKWTSRNRHKSLEKNGRWQEISIEVLRKMAGMDKSA